MCLCSHFSEFEASLCVLTVVEATLFSPIFQCGWALLHDLILSGHFSPFLVLCVAGEAQMATRVVESTSSTNFQVKNWWVTKSSLS